MSYFSAFPNIAYPFIINGKQTLINVKDIALNVRIRTSILSDISLYDEYDLMEGETPEILAEKLYGDANLHWVIMLANLKYDFYNDFPLPQAALEEYIKKKYGDTEMYAPHKIWGEYHYEDEDGNIVDGPSSETVRLITNYEHEVAENEKKRRIKVLHRDVAFKLIDDLENAFIKYVEE